MFLNMNRISDIKEAISFLKDGYIISGNGSDHFILKGDRVYHYEEGSRFSLKLSDFAQLYKNSSFFLYEEEPAVDETKDEAYYRYYRK